MKLLSLSLFVLISGFSWNTASAAAQESSQAGFHDAKTAAQKLTDMAIAYFRSRALHVAAQMGIADLLYEDSKTPARLADELNVDEYNLSVLLKMLSGHGVFHENENGTFSNSQLSALLIAGAQSSLRNFVITSGTGWQSETVQKLKEVGFCDATTAEEKLTDMAFAYSHSRALHVAARLGIADLLYEESKTLAQLARELNVHEHNLSVQLEMLMGHGVFHENEDGTFSNSQMSALLVTGGENSLRDFVLGSDIGWWAAVGGLSYSIKTGEPAFDKKYGMGYFAFLDERQELSQRFDQAMMNLTADEDQALADHYEFSLCNSIVDVGGNRGVFARNLAQAFPGKRVAVADRAHVVSQIEHMPQNMQAVACDFFESVPAEYDCYVLKRVMHDWNDEKSLQILAHCKAAMKPGAKLLLIDVFMPESDEYRNKPHPAKDFGILMMTLLPGKERTQEEYSKLLGDAGFEVLQVIPTPFEVSIIEAQRDDCA